MATLIVTGGNLVWTGTAGRGGHIMSILQLLHGLARLGHRVVYVDFTGDARPEAVALFRETIESWWYPALSALVLEETGRSLYGLDAPRLARLAGDAAAVIFRGCPFRREPHRLLEGVRPRILFDQDPGYSHVWSAEHGFEATYGEQDLYFTVGANVGSARCPLPTYGVTWRPAWNPVVLDWWAPHPTIARDRFTTIGGLWNEQYYEFEGRLWGPKGDQVAGFITLPELVGEALEMVVDSEPDDAALAALRGRGWRVEPSDIVSSPGRYRDYVSGSAGEFSCAKGLYVASRSGWFSDRSACYLAAGRPVVVQATGIADVLPTGRGLFSVETVEEAAAAIEAIRKDYGRHSAAARAIAAEHFDSGSVLTRLLAEAGIR